MVTFAYELTVEIDDGATPEERAETAQALRGLMFKLAALDALTMVPR